MAEEDFIHNIKDWFSLDKIPVHLDPNEDDGLAMHNILFDTKETRFYIKVIGPEGLNDMLVPCNELGSPTKDDWKVAGWMCTALNWAKQRTDDVLEELNLDGDDEDV